MLPRHSSNLFIFLSILLSSIRIGSAFVTTSGRGLTFGLSTKSFSAVYSELTDNSSPADLEPAVSEEKFTIYVSNVPFAVEDNDMKDIFSKAGTVKEVIIPRRKDSADSRGFAFIEMASKEDMEKAVQELDGYEFGGRAIQARVSLTKDQLPAKAKKEKSVKRSRAPEGPKVYVGNLPFDISPDELKELFEKYGEVTNVFLVKDNDGQNRGFGFVAMKTEEEVDAAIAEVDGVTFQGRRLAARRPLAEGEKAKPTPQYNAERIYFGNLSFGTTESTMRDLFQEHGKVLNLSINKDFATGKSRGYGFAQMLKEDASGAIAALDGLVVDGRAIRVTVSEDKVEKVKIYCGSLSFDTTEDTIRQLFASYGQVFSIYMPEDKEYGGSRGFAIITMAAEGATQAIQDLDGSDVDGRAIRVNEAKPRGEEGAAVVSSTTKLYVGNLDFDTTADTIRDAFSEFGEVKSCTLPEDRDYGGSRGFGFVIMNSEDAKVALSEMDGIELDGRVIRVTEADGRRGGNRNNDGYSDSD